MHWYHSTQARLAHAAASCLHDAAALEVIWRAMQGPGVKHNELWVSDAVALGHQTPDAGVGHDDALRQGAVIWRHRWLHMIELGQGGGRREGGGRGSCRRWSRQASTCAVATASGKDGDRAAPAQILLLAVRAHELRRHSFATAAFAAHQLRTFVHECTAPPALPGASRPTTASQKPSLAG